MALTSILLEFSEDPLSDASPSWTDVTSDLKNIEWWAGIDREGDEPKPGGATIRLKNTSRRWEPDFEAGQFFPNITTGRRFRLTLNDGGGSTQEGLWYVSDIALDYPAGTGYSEVTMSCSDGCEVLALDALPLMDPPDADSYADVVAFDEPWGYWRLGDPEGTQVVSHRRVSRKTRGKGKNRRKIRQVSRWRTVETAAETGGVSGPAGVYRGLPTLGQEGLIVGDTDTSVRFDASAASTQRVTVEHEDTLFERGNSAALECWVKIVTVQDGQSQGLISGFNNTNPSGSGLLQLTWNTSGTDKFRFAATSNPAGQVIVDSTTVPAAGSTYHVVGVVEQSAVRLYVNGVEEASASFSGTLWSANDTADPFNIVSLTSGTAVVLLDEPAVYEHALTAERVLAHYEAGSARGWTQQTAGERIADIATHALWSEANIQTAGRDVQPQFKHGQAKLDEISELAHAEGPRTMFFFNGNGDPVYLGHEWQATSSSYNTVQATLGDNGGEVGYEAIELVYDNETYNEVTASHESGEAATATDTTAQTERGRRANTEYTDLLLMEHNHVESLANAVLAFYKDPALRPVSVTVNGADTTRLAHILDRDIGHLVRVKKSGETGARIDRVANIIGKRKVLTADKLLTCQWTLSRGFNAGAGLWQAGVVGHSEAGSTTVAA